MHYVEYDENDQPIRYRDDVDEIGLYKAWRDEQEDDDE